MAIGGEGAIAGGRLYSEQDIQTRLHKYAQDKKSFQFMVLYERDSVSILKVISEKFGTVPSGEVTDFEFRYPEMDELPYEFVPHASQSDSPGYQHLSIDNDYASALHRAHHLIIRGIYMAPGGGTTDVVRTTTCFIPETVRILDIGLPDSAATGYTDVLVRRLWPYDAPGGAVRQITTAMTLVLSNSTSAEDALPNPAVSMNTTYQYNVIETTRESYGISEHIKSGIETFLLDKPLDIALRLTQIRYAKMIERAIIAGVRAKKKVGAKMEYSTGGILEFIPAANVISFPKIIQPKNFVWLVKDLFDSAGTEELWLFGGTNYVTALANAFDNKLGFHMDEAMSLKYALKVFSFEAVGRPGVLYIAGAPVLNQLGFSNEALVLNLEEKYKCFLIAEKEPLSDRPEGEETLSPKGQYSTYRELYSMWGFVRRLAKTHFMVIDTSISY
jgi:hypothetical protein